MLYVTIPQRRLTPEHVSRVGQQNDPTIRFLYRSVVAQMGGTVKGTTSGDAFHIFQSDIADFSV
jgi:hypothetical protein